MPSDPTQLQALGSGATLVALSQRSRTPQLVQRHRLSIRRNTHGKRVALQRRIDRERLQPHVKIDGGSLTRISRKNSEALRQAVHRGAVINFKTVQQSRRNPPLSIFLIQV